MATDAAPSGTLYARADNTRANRCCQACGFVHEGTEREAALVGDDWHDECVMGILAQDHAGRRGLHG